MPSPTRSCAACAGTIRKLTILHIDAHPDIYHAYQGNPRSHTSPFARIMEERLCDRLIQVGLRTINDHHRDQFKRFGVEVIEMRHWRDDLRLDFKTPVYVSLDIDGLDPGYAPGVSHREPGGPSLRQVINLIHSIDQPIVGADIVEYNPRCDVANMTATVAAKLVQGDRRDDGQDRPVIPSPSAHPSPKLGRARQGEAALRWATVTLASPTPALPQLGEAGTIVGRHIINIFQLA